MPLFDSGPRPAANEPRRRLTSAQRRRQQVFTGMIGAAAPLLDVLLRVGERISRLAEPTDHEYYPVRSLVPPEDDRVPGSSLPADGSSGLPGSSLGA